MTLLFVDSNAQLLESRTAFLKERLPGFTIVHFADPDKAAVWLASANALNVLVTEAIFDTDHSGFALRDAAEKRFPHVRVLLTTRFDLTGFEAQIRDCPVLKDGPYPPEKLVERVQTLFAAVDASTPPPVMVPGTVLGNYQVLDRLYIERESETYRALQITVQRPVALVLLKPEFLQQPDAVAKFKERIRVKASITFPRIAPLYEAGEVDRWLFYTRELPPGRTVEEIEEAGERLSERRLAEALFGIAEAMQHATAHDYHYRSLGPRDVYIDAEHQASITNLVDRLEQQGYLRREAHPHDRRTTLAALTDDGRSIIDAATEAVVSARVGLAELSDRDAKDLNRILRKLRVGAGDFATG